MIGSILLPITLTVSPLVLIPVVALATLGLFHLGKATVNFVKPRVEDSWSSFQGKYASARNKRKERREPVRQN